MEDVWDEDTDDLWSEERLEAEALRATGGLRLEAAGRTHIGRVRDTNEDAFAAIEEVGLFMVADGMGGHAFGEVASRMAVEVVRACFEDPDATWPLRGGRRLRGGLPVLRAAVQRANGRIFEAARRAPRMRGMGTTFVGVLAEAGRVFIAHVGDSRAYRLRRGERLERLTDDHSLLQDYIRLGVGTRESEDERLGHILTRALGTEDSVEVETRIEDAQPGDVLLLCSDGLTGVVKDSEIASVLGSTLDPDESASMLIELANEAGGPDNVTCVVVRWSAVDTTDSVR